MRLVADLAAVLTVGTLLAAAALLPPRRVEGGSARSPIGTLGRSAHRCLRTASVSAVVCAAAALVEIVLTFSDFLGATPGDALDLTQLRSFVSQTTQGRALAVQVVLAVFVAVAAMLVVTPRGAAIVGLVALGAVMSPALTGHSAASDDHMLAVWSLLVHVVATSLWVGGLAALALVARQTTRPLAAAVPRFSRLALWCVIAVGASGLVNAWLRLGNWDEVLGSDYGRLVLAKIAALTVLTWFGWQHRRRSLPHLSGPGAGSVFLRLAALELLIMAATFGLAVGLSRTPTPVPSDVESAGDTAAQTLLGYPLPDAPTLARLVTGTHLDGFAITFVTLAAALYGAGLRSLLRRGDSWPKGRSLAWYGGLTVVLVVTCSGIGRYAPVLFSVHMVTHMTLNMLAPLLLVLGAPVTLALRTLPRDTRAGLLAALHSWPARVLCHPLVAAAIFVSSLYLLYFTPLFETLMRDHWGHILMEVHFLLAGTLFFWVLVGVDPGPRRPPYPFRILLLFVVMGIHAFFSVAIMSTSTVIAEGYYTALARPWGATLLDDQHVGGSIGWAFGEIPILLVLITMFVQWVRADERAARASDRAQDRAERAARSRAEAADNGDGDAPAVDALARYNEWLAALARTDEKER
jgi:putative copper resistance protein D